MQLEQKVEYLTRQLTWYEEQLRLAQHKRFGASSERSDADQLRLFNEVETEAATEVEEEVLPQETEAMAHEKRKRRAAAREEMLKNLPDGKNRVSSCRRPTSVSVLWGNHARNEF
ncbi:transposase domain-containing protein [Alicyclobacillus acidoterrestris]